LLTYGLDPLPSAALREPSTMPRPKRDYADDEVAR
jgi:hypothetical protein